MNEEELKRNPQLTEYSVSWGRGLLPPPPLQAAPLRRSLPASWAGPRAGR